MKSRRFRVVVTRKSPGKGAGLANIRTRPTPPQDSAREHRISTEVVVDAYDGAECALGWYSYLEDRLEFPFTAKCMVQRAVSPLLVDDEVEVIAMAHDMFVMMRWEHGGLGVRSLSSHRPRLGRQRTSPLTIGTIGLGRATISDLGNGIASIYRMSHTARAASCRTRGPGIVSGRVTNFAAGIPLINSAVRGAYGVSRLLPSGRASV